MIYLTGITVFNDKMKKKWYLILISFQEYTEEEDLIIPAWFIDVYYQAMPMRTLSKSGKVQVIITALPSD